MAIKEDLISFKGLKSYKICSPTTMKLSWKLVLNIWKNSKVFGNYQHTCKQSMTQKSYKLNYKMGEWKGNHMLNFVGCSSILEGNLPF